MGATVAMERSIEFHLLGFYTLCYNYPVGSHSGGRRVVAGP